MRLFVAVWPSPEVVRSLGASPLVRGVRPELQVVRPEQSHVTLRFLGDATDLDDAAARLHRIDTRGLAGTTAVLDHVAASFGSSVLYLPIDGLDVLAERVAAAFGPPTDDPDQPSFVGHLTVARARGRRTDVRWWVGAPVLDRPRAWPVAEVALVRSDRDDAGRRYTTVASAPLPPRAGGPGAGP